MDEIDRNDIESVSENDSENQIIENSYEPDCDGILNNSTLITQTNDVSIRQRPKRAIRKPAYQVYKLKSAVCSEMAVVNIFSYNRNVMLFFV